MNNRFNLYSTELLHYASPYYDPVKAHEYYEQHKKLKGKRPSTAGLNDRGKEAARYVKERIQEERKAKVEKSKEERDSNVEARKEAKNAEVESHKSEMNARITSLRDRLKTMSKEDKAQHREEIQNEINELRNNNRMVRDQLQRRFSQEREGFNKTHKENTKRYKQEADEKYDNELMKMMEDSSFKKIKKTGSGKKKGSASSKKKTSSGNSQVRLEWDEKAHKYK